MTTSEQLYKLIEDRYGNVDEKVINFCLKHGITKHKRNKAVKTYFETQSELLEQVNQLLKQNQDPLKAIESLQQENNTLKKEIAALAKIKINALKDVLKAAAKEVQGVSFIAKEVDLDAQGMKDLSFDLGADLDRVILVLGSNKTGKPLLSCYISKSVVAEFNKDAGAIIRKLGTHIQGGGGGQAFYATAGGKNTEGLGAALAAAEAACFD